MFIISGFIRKRYVSPVRLIHVRLLQISHNSIAESCGDIKKASITRTFLSRPEP